jgi:hypothetical protein
MSFNAATLLGTVEPVRPIRLVSSAMNAFVVPITMAMKCTFIGPLLVAVVIVETPRRGK